jgi:hypothetical protein
MKFQIDALLIFDFVDKNKIIIQENNRNSLETKASHIQAIVIISIVLTWQCVNTDTKAWNI